MPLNKNDALRRLYERVPRLQPVMREIYGLVTGRPPMHFTGWLMSTDHAHAWEGDEHFATTLDGLSRLEFSITDVDDLDGWRWRHWIIAYAVRHSLDHTACGTPVFVECGVADGMTAYVALREAARHGDFLFHLYDAWAGMEADRLRPSELKHAGSYSELELKLTTRNLAEFRDHIEVHVGFVPDTLTGPPPDELVYLHIDLNSADPTVGALDHFWPALQRGGVILFDDYGWRDWDDTRKVVDEFLSDKPGTLLGLPTGQALYFR